jgi:O-antigen ligase/polysaccharide polymerase Wzy-like membrane protein
MNGEHSIHDVRVAVGFAGAVGGLAAISAFGLVEQQRMLLALAGLVLLLLVAGALSARADAIFAGWMVLAPFLQNPYNPATPRALIAVLYLVPPLLFVVWSFSSARSEESPRPRFSWFDALPLAFVLLALGSILSQQLPITTFNSHGVWGQYVSRGYLGKILYTNIAIGVICYYFCAFGARRRGFERRVVNALLVTSAIVAFVALLERFSGTSLGGFLAKRESKDGRVVGTFLDANALGGFLGVALVIAVAVLVWRGPETLRWPSIVLLVVGVPALAFTLTRAALLAVVAVVILMASLHARARWTALGAVVLALVIGIASWSNIKATRVYQERLSNHSNVASRQLLTAWSIDLAQLKPITGWGYGSFDRVKNTVPLPSAGIPREYAADDTSHNTFLTVLVELGSVGLGLLLVPWLIIAYQASRLGINVAARRWFVIAWVATLLVYVINASFSDFRFFSFVAALPWIALGMLRRGMVPATPAAPS